MARARAGAGFWAFRRNHVTRNGFLALMKAKLTRSRFSGMSGRGCYLARSSRFRRYGVTTESFLPVTWLAMLVLFKEALVITLAYPVAAPIGIGLPEMIPVSGMAAIPRLPIGAYQLLGLTI